MRNHLAALLTIFLNFFFASLIAQAQQAAPTLAPAKGASDSHEGITITVDPWILPANYKETFPKKTPLTGGVVALHVTIRNDSAESVKVDLKRIRLLLTLSEENRQELTPLTADEVADTVLLSKGTKDPTVRRNPLPIPVGKPNPTRDKNWTDFRDICQNASLPSPVVATHSSMDGLVYFDLRGETELLQNSKLYVPDLYNMSSKSLLSYFEIDLGHSIKN